MLKIVSRLGNTYYYDHFSNNFYTYCKENTELYSPLNFEQFTPDSLINPQLKFLIINLTNNCNMRCSYCAYSGAYYYQRSHETRHIDRAVAKRAIDIYFENSLPGDRNISFYGGEPTTAPKLLCWLTDYIHKKDPSVKLYINTNLLYIDNKLLEYIISSEFIIYVSINGIQHIHDEFRVDINGKPTFLRIKNNLQKIFNIDYEYYQRNIAFIATLTRPYNIDNVRNLYENEAIFQQPWLISTVMPFDNSFTNDIDLFKYNEYNSSILKLADDYIDAALSGREHKHFGHWVFGEKLSKIYHRDMMKNAPLPINNCCVPGVEKLFVDIDGRFHCCEKNTTLFSIGSVWTGINLQSNWPYISQYSEDCKKYCGKCPNARFCDLCYVSAIENDHFNFKRKRTLCENRVKHLNILMYIFVSVMEQNYEAFSTLQKDF